MFHDRQDQLLVHNEIVVHMDINKDVHYKSTNYLHLNRDWSAQSKIWGYINRLSLKISKLRVGLITTISSRIVCANMERFVL